MLLKRGNREGSTTANEHLIPHGGQRQRGVDKILSEHEHPGDSAQRPLSNRLHKLQEPATNLPGILADVQGQVAQLPGVLLARLQRHPVRERARLRALSGLSRKARAQVHEVLQHAAQLAHLVARGPSFYRLHRKLRLHSQSVPF